jgi:O-antigen/teichoic acid export membrane protein
MSENKVVKATLWYTISNFLLKGIGFITTPIFARILTKGEYGSFNNFAAWLSIISIVATLSLISSLIRGRFDYEKDLSSFVLSNLVLGSLSTVIVSVVLLTNIGFFSGLFALERKYIVMMCLYILVNPAYDMFLTIQRFEYKYKLVVCMSVVSSLSSVGISLLLIRSMQDHLLARVIGVYLPSFLISIVLYTYFIIKGKRVKVDYWKYSLAISLPYVVHLLSGTLLNNSDRTMITNMCGAEETALYSMAYNLAMIVSIMWSSMNSAYSPWFGEKMNEKKYDEIKKNSYLYIGIFSIGIIGIMLVAPEVLLILGGKSYIEAKYVIPPVILGYLFIFLYSLYVNIEQYEKNTLGMAFATIASALFNISMNTIFIPRYGYIAAAYTTLAGYILMFSLHYLIVRKMGYHKIYDTKYIALVSLTLGGISLLALLLYNYNVVRYLVLLLYIFLCGVLIYLKKNVWMQFFKKKGSKNI